MAGTLKNAPPALPAENAAMASDAQVAQYRDRGYFVVDDAVDRALLDDLAAAAQRVVAKVRSGAVVDDPAGVGTDGPGVEPHFVTGLIAPQFGEPVFGRYLASEALARYLRPFLGGQLRLGWVHLCAIRGEYRCGWHRDTGGTGGDGGRESELAILARHRSHFMKWHTALVDDPCLWIVPGSQKRYRTQREHECMNGDSQGDIPGAKQIALKKGQTVFWNGNSVHRGLKPEGMGDRATLMGALIDHRTPYDAGEKGDQRWLLADAVGDALPPRARRYYDNWRALAAPRMGAGSEPVS